MHHSVSIESDDEHKLRILHAHLSRKREALRKIERVVTDAALRGAISPEIAREISDIAREAVRSESDLTEIEHAFTERDRRAEAILRHCYPAMTDVHLAVCLTTLNGLRTNEISSVLMRSTKSIDHYRQQIRQIIGIKGEHTNLRNQLRILIESKNSEVPR